MQVLRPHPEAIYKGTIDAVRSIARSPEGIGRLWRGVWSVVIGAGPAHALHFGTYEKAKQLLVPEGADAAQSPAAVAASGALATSIADGFMTPFDGTEKIMFVLDYKVFSY